MPVELSAETATTQPGTGDDGAEGKILAANIGGRSPESNRPKTSAHKYVGRRQDRSGTKICDQCRRDLARPIGVIVEIA